MQEKNKIYSIGVLTSGGDAPGMNASVRAVVKTALHFDIEVYGIYQGYQGMVQGGDLIRKMDWSSVGGIMHKGGTIIGTARSNDFREREGRKQAAKNLVERGIDSLVIIGGDGSLTGADIFKGEWPDLIKELLDNGEITEEQSKKHPKLNIVGLVGSIDNDMSGTDMTIGADTALKRITDAIDAISSTAASHQRTFVIEVMGRNCGYLALIGGLATGADFIMIPEFPPKTDDWTELLCEVLTKHKEGGKKKSLIVVAEGARDRHGNPIKSHEVVRVLKEKMGEEARLTILGHVQRGGSPTAFDRYTSTVLGYAAVRHLIDSSPDDESMIIGMQRNQIVAISLSDSVAKTRSIVDHIKAGNFQKAIELRGGTFGESLETFLTLSRSFPHPPKEGQKKLKLLLMHSDGPAPGMNTAVRTAVRIGMELGHEVYGAHNSFSGLIGGEVRKLDWMEVEDWTSLGGSELGTNRRQPQSRDFYEIAKQLEKHQIDGIMIIGGFLGYNTAYELIKKRGEFSAFHIPIVCVPASINNNLPGTDFSIGADTALNNIMDAVDKIKESAIATKRTFVVQVMGRYCGYLALMSGLATGAEQVYLHEDGITLKDLQRDVELLLRRYNNGKRLGLVIRNEYANDVYDTQFIAKLYEEEGGDVFDVREAILGHLQQGGDPSPFDRSIATRLASRGMEMLVNNVNGKEPESKAIGLQGGHIISIDIEDMPKHVDMKYHRPKHPWWHRLKEIFEVFAFYDKY
jgi:6-phosphofructokinase 1